MEPFIGTMMRFAGNYAPKNWKFCDGTLLSIKDYEALYSILDNSYGGDGKTTFALPNLKQTGQDPITQNGFGRYIIAIVGMFPMPN